MNHENNDYLRADLYKDLSGSIASSLNSILGSRKNSVILEGVEKLFDSSGLTSFF